MHRCTLSDICALLFDGARNRSMHRCMLSDICALLFDGAQDRSMHRWTLSDICALLFDGAQDKACVTACSVIPVLCCLSHTQCNSYESQLTEAFLPSKSTHLPLFAHFAFLLGQPLKQLRVHTIEALCNTQTVACIHTPCSHIACHRTRERATGTSLLSWSLSPLSQFLQWMRGVIPLPA